MASTIEGYIMRNIKDKFIQINEILRLASEIIAIIKKNSPCLDAMFFLGAIKIEFKRQLSRRRKSLL